MADQMKSNPSQAPSSERFKRHLRFWLAVTGVFWALALFSLIYGAFTNRDTEPQSLSHLAGACLTAFVLLALMALFNAFLSSGFFNYYIDRPILNVVSAIFQWPFRLLRQITEDIRSKHLLAKAWKERNKEN